MKTQKIFSRVLDGLILSALLLFFASAGFQDKSTSGWYQQFFPTLNGGSIVDITFLDSLTGFAVTSTVSSQSYILKTTNGGNNWIINYNSSSTWGFRRIISIDSNTIFAVRSYTEILKTTNRGINWEVSPLSIFCDDISIISKDTMLIVNGGGFDGGVYRSTNGGINWQYIWNNSPDGNPTKIYMFDKNLGFTQDGSNFMRRTTDGGFNWTILNGEFFSSIKFYDSNTGWNVLDSIKKTTNGGLNWIAQKTPNITNEFASKTEFSILNKDTVWMVGARKFRGPVYKTTNGGTNWGYQFPDTTLQMYNFGFVQFVNAKVGWINPASPTSLMHTVTGGNDTTYFTTIISNSTVLSEDYQLFQNYPNPFNTTSKIKYKILKSSNIRISVFDILGKEIATLTDKKQNAGTYDVAFDGGYLPSGIYFYSLIIEGKIADTKRMVMIK